MVLKKKSHRECMFGMDFEVQLESYKGDIIGERSICDEYRRVVFCFVFTVSLGD